MNLFKQLSPEEEAEFRTWARENYTPFSEVSGVWHPVVIEECARINASTSILCGSNEVTSPGELFNEE